MSTNTSSLANQVSSHLAAKGLVPTPAWLNDFLASQKTTTPPVALKQTATFRLLASNWTQSLQRTAVGSFPSDILDGTVKERRLAGPIPVQVLDVEDVGSSRWSQIEAIEDAERGETTKGREVIRVVPNEDGPAPQPESRGPHKLLLQDSSGTTVYAFELVAVDGVGLSMNIGLKMVLRNVAVARGVLMLEPGCVTILGGKIEELQKSWRDGRKAALKAGIPAQT